MKEGIHNPAKLFKEEMDPTKNPVDFKPTFNHKPAEALLKTTPDCIYGYESPVDIYVRNMVTDLQEKRDGEICAQMKALAYDRNQYEEGYRKGYARGFKNGLEEVATVPVTITRGEQKWSAYYDKARNLLYMSPMTKELAEQLGITWEEIDEQKRREEE